MISKNLSCLAVKFVPPSHCLSYGFRKYFPQQIPVFENAKGKRKTNVFLGKNDKHAFMIKVSRFLAKFKVSFVYIVVLGEFIKKLIRALTYGITNTDLLYKMWWVLCSAAGLRV